MKKDVDSIKRRRHQQGTVQLPQIFVAWYLPTTKVTQMIGSPLCVEELKISFLEPVDQGYQRHFRSIGYPAEH